MDDQISPWEDINPPMVSARRAEPQSAFSDRLRPATGDQFRDELEACLALVVPVGMTEDARAEWLAVAWETLKHLPADLLSRGCAEARKTCDHPSKIVPAIVAETRDSLERRRSQTADDTLRIAGPAHKKSVMERRGQPMSEDDTEELNGILERLGATARYRSDGTRYVVEPA